MKKLRKEYSAGCAISEIAHIKLGGYEQRILLEGKNADAPVVLFLHGGPGFPPPFCVGARGLFPDITDRFIAVYWDQYGSGINHAKIDDSFCIAQFVRMTEELIAYLKDRFPAQKLYLFAVSWGSMLSAYAARSVPDLIDGVCAAGQIVLPPMLSGKTFEAVARSRAPKKAKRAVAEIGNTPRPTAKQIALLSKTVRKYTAAYGKKEKKSGVENPMKGVFESADYRFSDKIACFVNGYRHNTSLLKELSTIDLSETLAGVSVPYCIYGGDGDLVTCVEEAQALAAANNPLLRVTVLQGEGHIPSAAAIKEIFGYLCRTAGV